MVVVPPTYSVLNFGFMADQGNQPSSSKSFSTATYFMHESKKNSNTTIQQKLRRIEDIKKKQQSVSGLDSQDLRVNDNSPSIG